MTDRGREFCGRPERHPYELFLELNDIEHRLCKVATPRTNGFVERFHRTALDEFFRLAFRKKLYLTVEELQADLDTWLKYYNEERPHQGYRNMGRRPAETVEEGKKRASFEKLLEKLVAEELIKPEEVQITDATQMVADIAIVNTLGVLWKANRSLLISLKSRDWEVPEVEAGAYRSEVRYERVSEDERRAKLLELVDDARRLVAFVEPRGKKVEVLRRILQERVEEDATGEVTVRKAIGCTTANVAAHFMILMRSSGGEPERPAYFYWTKCPGSWQPEHIKPRTFPVLNQCDSCG